MTTLNDKQDAITILLSSMGITMSIQDIQNIVSIVLLVLSIVNAIWVMVSRIYKHFKNKEYDEIDDDIQKAIDDISKLKDGDSEDGKQ